MSLLSYNRIWLQTPLAVRDLMWFRDYSVFWSLSSCHRGGRKYEQTLYIVKCAELRALMLTVSMCPRQSICAPIQLSLSLEECNSLWLFITLSHLGDPHRFIGQNCQEFLFSHWWESNIVMMHAIKNTGEANTRTLAVKAPYGPSFYDLHFKTPFHVGNSHAGLTIRST